MIAGIEYPQAWIKGQLLDLKRYTNGTYDAFLLGADEKGARKVGEYVSFQTADEAQAFVSAWYQPETRT